MGSNQATRLLLERAGILLEKREARRRQWQQLYGGDRLFVPNGLRLVYDGEGRAFVGFPFGTRSSGSDENLRRGNLADDRGILDAFVRLADEERPERFLEFAKRYGLLQLCDAHGLPWPHPVYDSITPSAKWTPCVPGYYVCGPSEAIIGDPVDGVRRHAAEVRAVLVAAAALHRGEGMPEEARVIALRTLQLDLFSAKVVAKRDGLKELGDVNDRELLAAVWGWDDRALLAQLIDAWIERARLRPTYTWTDSFPHIGLRSDYTYGAIIRQLAFAVAQVRGVAVCAGCGQPFVPYRRWKYCRSCGKRAADREAQRRRRARLAAKK